MGNNSLAKLGGNLKGLQPGHTKPINNRGGIAMDMKQVNAFLAVARYLSFGEAAEELSFSTSAISKQISALEKELDVKLFSRKGSAAVQLTREGELLMPHFVQLYREHQQLQACLHTSIAAIKGRVPALSFSYPSSLSSVGEDRLIERFRQDYPEIPLQHTPMVGRRIVSAMASGELDACLFISMDELFERMLLEHHMPLDSISFLALKRSSLIMALGERHPQAGQEILDLASMREETFLFRRFYEGVHLNGGHLSFEKACRQEGFSPKILFTGEGKDSLVFQGAASGKYIIPLVFPPNTQYGGIKIKPLSKSYYSGELRLYYLQSNRSPSLKKFLNCAREVYHVT